MGQSSKNINQELEGQMCFFGQNQDNNEIGPVVDLLGNPIKNLQNKNIGSIKDLLEDNKDDDKKRKVTGINIYTKGYKSKPRPRTDMY